MKPIRALRKRLTRLAAVCVIGVSSVVAIGLGSSPASAAMSCRTHLVQYPNAACIVQIGSHWEIVFFNGGGINNPYAWDYISLCGTPALQQTYAQDQVSEVWLLGAQTQWIFHNDTCSGYTFDIGSSGTWNLARWWAAGGGGTNSNVWIVTDTY